MSDAEAGLGGSALRSIALALAVAVVAVAFRFSGVHLDPAVSLLIFGAGVVGASFMLAWAAEAARLDISGGLAIAILAFIAVLPEYAVDLYFAYTAGHDPTYTSYAAANMTGSNRLLMGLGWPVVVLVGLAVARRAGQPSRSLALSPDTRVELGFLLVAGVVSFIAPLTGQISLLLAFALFAWFAYFLYRVANEEPEAPHLIGTALAIGSLPERRRRQVVVATFVAAAAVVLACAEPFAHSLIETGTELGIDRYLLVQWLGPLASEAPEFIVAILFALRGNARDGIGTLISSKVNQWTLLLGSLPVAYWIGGGGPGGLPLDQRQVEEVLLTASQTLMGVAVLLPLRFPRWAAWSLLGLFAVQFAITGNHGRSLLALAYILIAIGALAAYRRFLVPTIKAPFTTLEAAER